MAHLKDRHVLVIGGSSGIGLATARLAMEDGAHVTITGRDTDKLNRAAVALGGAEAIQLDLADEAGIAALFDGRSVDHVGITGPGPGFYPFTEADIEQVRADFDAKFWGQYRIARQAVARLVETASGGSDASLTFMSGAFSQRPIPGASTLAAIQSGLEGLARALAVEVGPVRVNAVSPGLTDTPLIRGLFGDGTDDLYADTARGLPAQRVAQPEDIAETFVMLMRNRSMTGSTIYPDGGLTLRG
ncbi:SDR family oxidoreductase [Jannaschia aquimarina]|uniref:LinC protein n=1 Tax=Jannaschia aquimarina TaxID=935700 RepID=A0A0D1DDL8_9RHOB|nr:SDR family oxidoreductase [Jannaschia aquimarina]KIT18088.1 2,5-dichloro-2,5-cyclohexadiene-1,4-diol dehydrogenase [Jannaschia aquimarina]SNT40674.1 NAD(P)-dependent dehydrogenase, short-chain alcohol dehydrogenase family [Jannaschia aquimarina]